MMIKYLQYSSHIHAFLLSIFLLWINTTAYAQSPYAVFGDSSLMLEADRPFNNTILPINILSEDGCIYFADFNLMKGNMTQQIGHTIFPEIIKDYEKAMFMAMDPHIDNYHNLNPYIYCGGNPINAIDPDGKDWYRNNDTSYYTWFYGSEEKEGFTHIGGVGSLLGEFEAKINTILIDLYEVEYGLYGEGRTIDITNSDKGAIVPSQYSKMDDFLDEFVFGYGPEISILKDDHPYTQVLKQDERVVVSQQDLREGRTEVSGQITGVGRSWGLIDCLTTPSMAKQFVGSYSFDSYISEDKRYLINIISDTKNFRSFFYHIPGAKYLNHSRSSAIKPFSTTYQFYIWKSKR